MNEQELCVIFGKEDSAALINKYTKELKRELNQILNASLDKICAGYCGV